MDSFNNLFFPHHYPNLSFFLYIFTKSVTKQQKTQAALFLPQKSDSCTFLCPPTMRALGVEDQDTVFLIPPTVFLPEGLDTGAPAG